MHIILVSGRNVVVDNVAYVLDVDAARRDVRRHKHLYVSILKKRERSLAPALIFVAVDRFGLEAALSQVFRKLLDAVLGAAKDEYPAEFRLREEIVQNVYLVFTLQAHDVLLDRFCRVARLDRYPHRIFQKVADQFFDVARERCGEKERLALARNEREDFAHVVNETHVEHAIRFVQNDRAEFRKVEHTAFDEIFDASWCPDDKIRIVAQAPDLRIDVGAADDAGGKKAGAVRKAPILLIYLKCKLARRDHDKNALFAIFHDFVEKRDKERACFPRAGVCDADDITSEQYVWNGFVLNRGRGRIPFLSDVVFDAWIDVEIHE